jgi:hypothetical protein
MEPISLTIGVVLALASVGKAAHEKSFSRQLSYANEITRQTEELAKSETEIEEKKKAALRLAAVKAAVEIGERRRKEAEAIVKKKQQNQMLIAATLGVVAIGFIVYSLKKA